MSSQSLDKRILAIDGGGFGALGCLLIIDKIVQEVKKMSSIPNLLPCQIFDLICGSSTGGLVALLLGRFGLDCGGAIRVYETFTKEIVSDDWDKLKSGSFDPSAFEQALDKLILTAGREIDPPIAAPVTPASALSRQNTQTFITVASYAPDYTDRVYHIRSYPTPKGASAASPPGHTWSVREAARATTAGQYTHIPSFFVKKSSGEFEFCDPGTIGFNNPTQLARREADRLWRNDRVGAVVSIGTGLTKLAPNNPTVAWNVTDDYAMPWINEVVANLLPQSTIEDTHLKNAKVLTTQLLSNAVDSELVHNGTNAELRDQGIYYRVNPPLNISVVDLLDFNHGSEVEEAIKQWLDTPEQKQRVRELASRLVRHKPVLPNIRSSSILRALNQPPSSESTSVRLERDIQSPGVEIDGYLHL